MSQKHTITKIGKFDLNKIGNDNVCVFIGKRRSGKSFMIRDLIYHNRNIPSAVVVSGSEKASPYYSRHIPSPFIHNQWDPDLIQNVLKKQITSKEKRDEMGAPDKGYEMLLLFDDLMFDKSWIRHQTTSELFMNGRHYKILFLIALQYALGIPPALRTNIDYVFIFRENNKVNRKKIWEQYASIIPDFKLFCDIMDACTKDYKCLVIDNSKSDGGIEECVFWFKAKERKNFSVGSKKYWKTAKKYNAHINKKEIVNDNTKGSGVPMHKVVLTT